MTRKKSTHLGLKQALEMLLDLFCYAYYVKSDSIVSDQLFDELERLYCLYCAEQYAPSRACERKECYKGATEFFYNYYKEKERDK